MSPQHTATLMVVNVCCNCLRNVKSHHCIEMFLYCIYFQEFRKLADRLLLKNVKDDEHFIQLMRCNLSILAEVIPSQIMPYLLSKNVIRLAFLF